MNKFSVSEAFTTLPKHGISTQTHFAEIYKQLGIYFINNAERLGKNIVDNTSGIEISIKLEPSSFVTIDISQKELLMKELLSADAAIEKLQVEPKFEYFYSEKVGNKVKGSRY